MSIADPPPGAAAAKEEKKYRGPGKPVAGILLTPAAVARELGLSPKTTREWIARGWLPSRQLGGRTVIIRAELEQFVAGLPGGASVQGALGRLATIARATGRT